MSPEIMTSEEPAVLLQFVAIERYQIIQQRKEAVQKAHKRMEYYLDVLFKKYIQVKFVTFIIYPTDYSDGEIDIARSDIDDCSFNGVGDTNVLQLFDLEPGDDITSTAREMVWSNEKRRSIPNENFNKNNADIVKLFRTVLQFKTLNEWIECVGDNCTVLVAPGEIKKVDNDFC